MLDKREGEIAETILLPGDPRRTQFIAENFLESPVQYNLVRNILGLLLCVIKMRVIVYFVII
jgi:purine-nucleoside phosphorylase